MTNALSNSSPTPAEIESTPLDRSSAYKNAFELSPSGLTYLLLVMCFIPVVTILVLWQILPPVMEGELNAVVTASEIPNDDYYETEYYERRAVPVGKLLVHNPTDQDWEMPNIIVNTFYQIYDTEPIKAGETRAFDLDRFITRTGAKFQVRYNQLDQIRMFAKLPDKTRASFNFDFRASGYPDPASIPPPQVLEADAATDSNSAPAAGDNPNAEVND